MQHRVKTQPHLLESLKQRAHFKVYNILFMYILGSFANDLKTIQNTVHIFLVWCLVTLWTWCFVVCGIFHWVKTNRFHNMKMGQKWIFFCLSVCIFIIGLHRLKTIYLTEIKCCVFVFIIGMIGKKLCRYIFTHFQIWYI